jgi:hypothetical protein
MVRVLSGGTRLRSGILNNKFSFQSRTVGAPRRYLLLRGTKSLSMMNIMHIKGFQIFVCLTLVFMSQSKDTPQRRKAKKPMPAIDWNNSYYASRFDNCKPLRRLNPVEAFRAQAYAATIFRKCAPKVIVNFASKHNYPAYGEEGRLYTNSYTNDRLEIGSI